jgi:F-type H+-transporting ATPase subunit b
MNLWHGLFMVNNERALQPGFVNQLLFRYENPKDPCDPKNEPAPFLASLINFGILVFVLFKYGRRPLADALQKRKSGIMAEIDTATKLKEDAEARLDEYQEQIDNIEAKLEEVRAEYAAQAEREKQHILVEAEERRVRMRKDAELRIEQELKAARAELLREAVVNAVAAAEELVAKQIAAKDLDKMANDYLSSVGASITGAR